MKIYPKQSKLDKKSNNFYFGDYDEIPVGVSFATLSKNGINKDKLHYHKKGYEFYITTQGSGIMEIEGKEIELNNEQMVMVEPGEKHKIKSAKKTPFSFFVFCTVKNKADKIILE